MTQTEIGRTQLRRINAFRGLMIDAGIWRDAHEYHRSQMRLHNLALHGWGIAHGLEVTLAPDRNTVVVQPGIAIDPAGNFIIITEPYLHRIEAARPGTVYLVVQFSEILTGPNQPASDPYGQPTRVVEAYRIQQRESVPEDPRLELCRVDFDPLASALTLPDDPATPGKNELDLRFRTPIGATGPVVPLTLATDAGAAAEPIVARTPGSSAGEAGAVAAGLPGAPGIPGLPGSAATGSRNGTLQGGVAGLTGGPALAALSLVVAHHSGQGWDAHADGLQMLAREAAYCGRPVTIQDAALTDTAAGSADLVYLTGTARLALGSSETEALGRLLERGGVLVGDGCASGAAGEGGAREFARSFAEIAEGLGRRLEAVQRGHPVFTGRYLFAQPPAGARSSTVLLADAAAGAAGSVLYCDADYGCAWNGGAPEHPLARGAIRDALELGVNLAFLKR